MNIEKVLVTLSGENLKEMKYQNSVLLALGNATCASFLLGRVTQQKGIPSFHPCPYSCFWPKQAPGSCDFIPHFLSFSEAVVQ